MRYDLARMARATGNRRRAATLAPIEPGPGVIAPLLRTGLRVVRAWEEVARTKLLPAYAPGIVRDAVSDDVRAVIEEAKRQLLDVPDDQLALWASQVENWHGKRFVQVVMAATGTDVELLIERTGSTEVVALHQQWAGSLIRDISSTTARRVENLTYAAVAQLRPRNELARDIAAVMGTSRKRAKFIARDQTMKLSGKLDEVRQREAGIDQYKWLHSRKEHPRLHHVARNGQVFSWDEPPFDGHPRTQPNCGCTAQAYLAILEEG